MIHSNAPRFASHHLLRRSQFHGFNIVDLRRSHLAVRESVSCDDNDGSCPKSSNSNSLYFLLFIVPIIIAIVVLVVIHRRCQKKQRHEDANDKTRSLDFGLELNKGAEALTPPEMVFLEREKSHSDRGISVDIGGSPYILPDHLHCSRKSLHPISRVIHDADDPYRPALVQSDYDSHRTRNLRKDNNSFHTNYSDGPDKSLLQNAQSMPRSSPQKESTTYKAYVPPANSLIPDIAISSKTSAPDDPKPTEPVSLETDSSRVSSFDNSDEALRMSNNYLGSLIQSRDSGADLFSSASSSGKPYLPLNSGVTKTVEHKPNPELPSPLRLQSMEAKVHNSITASDFSDYGNDLKITPPSPTNSTLASTEIDNAPTVNSDASSKEPGLALLNVQLPANRLSLSVRPLPHEDPTESAEQRANRIRSFYKEYFDESRPDPAGQHRGQSMAQSYYAEDYLQEYQSEGAIVDSKTGKFVVAQAPFAEPIMRRAMTPPPRAPPQHAMHGSSSVTSNRSRFLPPRGMSSMSGKIHNRNSRKPYVPPTPLTSLPTPHMLRDDSMVFNPVDFAPPVSYRDRQAGRRPDSPLGVSRPYSPVVKPHTPLVGAYDDLSLMPSPHALRKSGTFTALDFAPPTRFKGSDGSNDSGSIRSNKAGTINVMQLNSLRNGAYRVSRIPRQVVGTRDELIESLKPTWDLRAKGSPSVL